MDKDELMEELTTNECLLADGFDNALIGITEGLNPVAVYDTDKCIDILMKESIYPLYMNHEDAVEYFYFNVAGAYVGEKTPLFIRMITED